MAEETCQGSPHMCLPYPNVWGLLKCLGINCSWGVSHIGSCGIREESRGFSISSLAPPQSCQSPESPPNSLLLQWPTDPVPSGLSYPSWSSWPGHRTANCDQDLEKGEAGVSRVLNWLHRGAKPSALEPQKPAHAPPGAPSRSSGPRGGGVWAGEPGSPFGGMSGRPPHFFSDKPGRCKFVQICSRAEIKAGKPPVGREQGWGPSHPFCFSVGNEGKWDGVTIVALWQVPEQGASPGDGSVN